VNVALGIEYDGGAFCGFQLQKHAPSVQGALEDALSRIAAAPIRVVAAGRTDTGVHATGQVVGFASPVERPLRAWVRGTNALLPPAVRVTWARAVDAGFSARYSAVARRYMYLFAEHGYEHEAGSPLLAGRVTPVVRLDHLAMHRAAQALLGEQDFSAVRGAGCQSRNAFRCADRSSCSTSPPTPFCCTWCATSLACWHRWATDGVPSAGSQNCWPAGIEPLPGRPPRRRDSTSCRCLTPVAISPSRCRRRCLRGA